MSPPGDAVSPSAELARLQTEIAQFRAVLDGAGQGGAWELAAEEKPLKVAWPVRAAARGGEDASREALQENLLRARLQAEETASELHAERDQRRLLEEQVGVLEGRVLAQEEELQQLRASHSRDVVRDCAEGLEELRQQAGRKIAELSAISAEQRKRIEELEARAAPAERSSSRGQALAAPLERRESQSTLPDARPARRPDTPTFERRPRLLSPKAESRAAPPETGLGLSFASLSFADRARHLTGREPNGAGSPVRAADTSPARSPKRDGSANRARASTASGLHWRLEQSTAQSAARQLEERPRRAWNGGPGRRARSRASTSPVGRYEDRPRQSVVEPDGRSPSPAPVPLGRRLRW